MLNKKQVVEGNWMSIKSVSDYTGLSISTIRRAIQKGKLKCSNRTGKLLFKRVAIDKWLEG